MFPRNLHVILACFGQLRDTIHVSSEITDFLTKPLIKNPDLYESHPQVQKCLISVGKNRAYTDCDFFPPPFFYNVPFWSLSTGRSVACSRTIKKCSLQIWRRLKLVLTRINRYPAKLHSGGDRGWSILWQLTIPRDGDLRRKIARGSRVLFTSQLVTVLSNLLLFIKISWRKV